MGITDPGQEYFKNGGWGWDGSKWVKNGLAFAYGNQIMGSVYLADGVAGENHLNGGVLPADALWVINTLVIHNNTHGVSWALLGVRVGGVNYWLSASGALAKQVGFPWSGQVVLKTGDKCIGWMGGCTLHDAIGFTYTGYQVRTT